MTGCKTMGIWVGHRVDGNQNKGFTLVELLVVMSIIALLLSILMSSLSKARDQARLVVCKSQIKQMGYLFEVYLGDNDQVYMPGFLYAKNSTGGVTCTYWPTSLQPYCQRWKLGAAPPEYFFCTGQSKEARQNYDGRIGFGYNAQYYNTYPGFDPPPASGSDINRFIYEKFRLLKSSDVPLPAKKILLADSRYFIFPDYVKDDLGTAYLYPPSEDKSGPGAKYCEGMLGARHNKSVKPPVERKLSVLWADSHVTSPKRGELVENHCWWGRWGKRGLWDW